MAEVALLASALMAPRPSNGSRVLSRSSFSRFFSFLRWTLSKISEYFDSRREIVDAELLVFTLDSAALEEEELALMTGVLSLSIPFSIYKFMNS